MSVYYFCFEILHLCEEPKYFIMPPFDGRGPRAREHAVLLRQSRSGKEAMLFSIRDAGSEHPALRLR